MSQSRLGSLYEVLLSIGIGFVLSFLLGHFLYPWYGMEVSYGVNFQITLWFTVLSIIRSYVVRRFFNSKLQRLAAKLAGDKVD
jgi:hypothetical protein